MRKKNYNQKYWDRHSRSGSLHARFTTSQDNFSIDTAKLKYPFGGSDIALFGPEWRLQDNGNWELEQEILSAPNH